MSPNRARGYLARRSRKSEVRISKSQRATVEKLRAKFAVVGKKASNMAKLKPIVIRSSGSNLSNLSTQQIDNSGPGTILADFEALLDFAASGVRSTGKYHLLPMDRLRELDEKMTMPLRPNLARPQQRSFPHINGLYLLLRATQIGIPEGQGKTSGRLTLDPLMCRQWLQLNPTERYFNLLEAWLRHASWEAIGLHSSGNFGYLAMEVRWLLESIPPEGRSFSKKEQVRGGFLHSVQQSTTLALLELFGLMTVERDQPAKGQNWCVTRVCHTPFGDELLRVVFSKIQRSRFADEQCESDFGAWQPVFQSSFPQWINNLKFAEPEFRDGIYYFKVSLGTPWRRIAISAESSLDELAKCIIGAFDFDGDHLYAFQFIERDGQKLTVEHPRVGDAELHTDEIAIGCLPLQVGESMPFQYDFGADWRFKVKLENIAPADPDKSLPIIVESHGEAPAEYDSDDEW